MSSEIAKLESIDTSCPNISWGRKLVKLPKVKPEVLEHLRQCLQVNSYLMGTYKGNNECLVWQLERLLSVLPEFKEMCWIESYETLGTDLIVVNITSQHAFYCLDAMCHTFGWWWMYRPYSTLHDGE